MHIETVTEDKIIIDRYEIVNTTDDIMKEEKEESLNEKIDKSTKDTEIENYSP